MADLGTDPVWQMLGDTTAYADAVAAGYIGTREQFGADQAAFAVNAREVADNLEKSKAVLADVNTAGTTQTNRVTAEGDTQVTRVAGTGSAQVNAVNSAGTSHINAVNTAGTTQVGNVNTAGTNNVNAVNTAGNTKISEIQSAGAVLYSSQTLADTQKMQSRTNIGAAADADLTAHKDLLTVHPWPFRGKHDLITAPASGDSLVNVTDAYAAWLKSLTIFGKSVQDGTPTPEVPIPISRVSGSLKKCGKNLIPYPYIEMSKTKNGLTFTVNTNGTVTITGTATADTTFSLRSPSEVWFVPRGIYTLSGTPAGGGSTTYFMQLQVYNGATLVSGVQDDGLGKTINLSAATYDRGSIYIAVKSGVVVSNIVFNPQLEHGSSVTLREPYTGATYASPDLQGTTLGATIPAIVSSNPALMSGVYHDGTQYHCCDSCEYAILSDGAYKKRTIVRTLNTVYDGSADEAWNIVDSGVPNPNGYYSFSIRINALTAQSTSNLPGYSNRWIYKSESFSIVNAEEFFIQSSLTYVTIYIRTKVASTLTEWKAWLALNNLTVVCVTTPIVTLGDPVFIDALPGVMNLYHTSAVQPHIDVAYPLDVVKYIDTKFTELSNAIVAAGAN